LGAQRVFLDANVLFSAAWRDDGSLVELWRLQSGARPESVRLLSSAYAVEEARRNLDTAERQARLADLVAELEIVAEPASAVDEAAERRLPEDDRPIFRAALAGRATHLLTGDRRAFGAFFGRRLGGLVVTRPADYLRATRE
jgi:predicted nucleic acid-binding protein